MNCRNLWIFFVFGVLLFEAIESKRSGGRSRSSNSRGYSLWSSNNKKKSSSSSTKPATPPQPNAELASLSYPKQTGNTPISTKPKPSAPRLETQNVQKSSISNTQTANKPIVSPPVNSPGHNAQTPGQNAQGAAPIGWNVPPNQANHGSQLQTKTFQQSQQQNSPPQYPTNYGNNYGAPVNTQYGNGGYGAPAYGNTGYGNPAYGSYGTHQAASGNYYNGGQTAYNPSGQSYNPQQPFQGYYPSANVGVIPPRGANAGNYYNSMAGIPNTPSFATHGGNGGGTFGSLFGGQRNNGYGYGGYGGYGGMGGFGSGGLMPQKRGFGSGFAGTAFTSLATGLLVWSVMRGGRSQYYNVYNHYNNPEAVPQEIPLPANVITLCSENATMLCAPNTVPLCTSNETIFCVVTAAATIPCQDMNGSSCVDTTIPCTADCGEGKENTTLTLPCIANATVSGTVNLQNSPESHLFTQNASETTLCVTTMAMPSPAEEQAAAATPAAPPNNMTDLIKPDTLQGPNQQEDIVKTST